MPRTTSLNQLAKIISIFNCTRYFTDAPECGSGEHSRVSNLNTEINLLVGCCCSARWPSKHNTHPSRRTERRLSCLRTWKPVGRLLFKSTRQTQLFSAKPNAIIIKYCPCIIRRITQWCSVGWGNLSAQPQNFTCSVVKMRSISVQIAKKLCESMLIRRAARRIF